MLKNNLKWLGPSALFVIALYVGFTFQNCSPYENAVTTDTSNVGLGAPGGPSDGVCGANLNSCTAGNFIEQADNATHYLWACNGTNGGLNAACSVLISTSAINGVCGTTNNACNAGTSVDVADSATQYLWSCNGANGGTNASCSMNIPTAPVNGACGTAVKDTCSAGTPVDVPDTASQYLWSCNGLNGGTNANCSMNITASATPVPGSCGNAPNSCGNGTTFQDVADNATQELWNCLGLNGGTAAACSRNKSVTCRLSVEGVSHFSENYTYVVTATGGTLPNPSHFKIYGTKSNMNGGGTVTDENGTTVISFNPAGVTLTNTGDVAGKYTRSFKVVNPSNNMEICTTNTVSQTLTPACGLSATPAVVTLAETFDYGINTNTTPALGGTVAKILWFGSKNGTPDENGSDYGIALNAYPYKMGPFTETPQAVGQYVRYMKATDAAGNILCRSNSVDITINNP